MLNGFAREALLVYPLYDDYIEKGSGYKSKLVKSVQVLKDYLNKCDIRLDCFSSDDVAHEVSISPDRWAVTLNRGDMFFVQNNCDGGAVLSSNVVTFDDIYVQTAEKYPIERGMSVERRFEVTLKRDSMARRLIARTYKIVILVKQPKSPAIRYTVKKDSGVVYLEIDNTSFQVKGWMSDMPVDIPSMLGIENAFMPAYEWEVPNGGNLSHNGSI